MLTVIVEHELKVNGREGCCCWREIVCVLCDCNCVYWLVPVVVVVVVVVLVCGSASGAGKRLVALLSAQQVVAVGGSASGAGTRLVAQQLVLSSSETFSCCLADVRL